MVKRPKTAKIALIIFLTIFCAANLSACRQSAAPMTEQSFLLDTLVAVTFYRESDRPAVMDALALCRDYELIFSRTNPDSELYRLNAAGSMTVSPALLEVLSTALAYCEASGGRYDITIGGVSALYDFGGDAHRPDNAVLEAALRHVGWENVRIAGDTVTLRDPEAVLDLGSIAKGWIADRMKELLVSRGVKHAILSLGGNILCLGGRPDGAPYRVGIQYPERDSTALAATVAVREESVVTSGVYERFFVENGEVFSHILDAGTGLPLQNGLLAVSVVGPCSACCDALSTLCFVLGPDDGLQYVEALEGYEAVFILKEGTQLKTAGFTAIETA